MQQLLTQNDVLDTARIEGLAEGREKGLVEGRAEGRAEEKLDNARKFKSLGVSAETIAQALGLTTAEMETL